MWSMAHSCEAQAPPRSCRLSSGQERGEPRRSSPTRAQRRWLGAALETSQRAVVVLCLLWSATALEGPRTFLWKGTQVVGAGCLEHANCAAGLFCKAEAPPEDECKTEMGWSVACGTCRPCSECRCNDDAMDAKCPNDVCPQTPASIPQQLGTRHCLPS